MRKPLLASLIAALTVSGLVAVGSPVSAAGEQVVLSRGHIDAFEVTFDPETSLPRLLVKDDTRLFSDDVAFRAPEDVTIDADHLRAAVVLPELPPEYDFLGAPGDTIYMLPEVQDEELPWAGWSSERLLGTVPNGTTLSSAGDAVKLSVAITGPGEVHSFMSDPVGGVINHYIDTSDGGPDIIPVGTSNHVHTNWSFSQQGTYTMTVTPSVETDTATVLTGSPSQYTFHIGDPLAPITPVVTPPGPVINGTPTVGTEIYGYDGLWKPAPTEYVSRQWLRDGVPIADATDTPYIVTAEDATHELTFSSTVRIGRETATATSAPVTAIWPAPTATTKPAVVGTPQVGRTVSAAPGTWTAAGLTHGYQWLRNGVAIPGATSATYTGVPADAGRLLSVRVTAARTDYATGVAVSTARTVALGVAPRPTTAPQLFGTPRVGRILRVTQGRWSPAPTTYTYRWVVGGRALTGKTGPRLRLIRAYRGKRVVVTVIAKRPGHLAGRKSIVAGRVG